MDADSFENGYGTLQFWRRDYEAFSVFFLARARKHVNRHGYFIKIDHEALRIGHAGWAAACDLWQKERVPSDSGPLSHLKVLSLLLHHMVQVDWAPELFDALPRNPTMWAGREDALDHIRKCINAGRGDYLTFQFVISLINWFEEGREDRSEPFVFRLTPDLEHDLMVYFCSEQQDELSTYLILKALYSRPGGNGN